MTTNYSSQASELPVLTDRTLVDFMRRSGASTISELVEFTGVTATAVRQRLNRLMEQGLVAREAESVGRGRPTHRYSLTQAGVQSGGDNYGDLISVLWTEIRAVEDPDVRHGLLKADSNNLSRKISRSDLRIEPTAAHGIAGPADAATRHSF